MKIISGGKMMMMTKMAIMKERRETRMIMNMISGVDMTMMKLTIMKDRM